MYWFSRCSWCGGPFNGGNYQHCTNVSFRDEFVRNPDPISNDEKPDFSYAPPQPQTSLLNQFHCFHCKDPLEDGVRYRRCTCVKCGYCLKEGFCSFCNSKAGNSFVCDSNPNSFNDPLNVFPHPPHPQYETYLCELCGNDSHHGYDCPARFPLVYEQEPCYNQKFGDNYYPQNSPSCPQQYFCCENSEEEKFFIAMQTLEEKPESMQELLLQFSKDLQTLDENSNQLKQEEQAAKVSSQYWKPPIYYDDDDDDEESSIPLRDIISELPLSVEITSDLPITDSLIMEEEHLNTILKMESDKENKSSVKDLNLTPSESEDLSDKESECDMPVGDVFLPRMKEFASELAPIDPIPPRIIPDAIIESFSPSPIPVEYSDSLMEEIDIFLAPDDSIPPGIENDDYDSKGDVLFLEELLNDGSISLPGYESFHVDFYNVPSSPRPPEKPPDDDVYFDIEPDTRVLTTKVVDDISDNSTRELYVHVPNILPTLPTLYLVFDTLLPFSSKNEDKVFNPGILISKEEKSPHLLSHRGFNVFQLINDSESPMMIYGGDIPILDVPYLHFYPP
ncbi:hypothetical protein Tco_0666782 [Tanacetum coccineum]